MGETKDLAKWLAGLRFSDLPDTVVDFTKRFILDDVGCMIGGALQLGNKALMRDVLASGEKPQSTIAVYGHKTSAPSAALVNGAFICGWDYDCMATGGAHLGSQSAALIAMSEMKLVNGREMITAECAGIEAQCRIGSAGAFTGAYRYPWHSNTTLGPFAAAVTTGKILEFDADTMENAIAIVLHSMGGNYQHFYTYGSSMKRIRCGIGAWSGIRAALLAKEGIVGPSQALEGSMGFLEVMAGRKDDGTPCFDSKRITEELGGKWYLYSYNSKGGACLCVSPLGSALETTLALRKEYHLKTDEIESVVIEFPNEFSLRQCNWILGTQLGDTPEQRLGSSGWSARWMIAEALVMGKPSIRVQLNNSRPYGRYVEIEELSSRISCRVNEEYYKELDKKGIYYPRQAGRVITKLKSGRVLDGAPLPYKGLNDAKAENMHTLESLTVKLEEQATTAGISKMKQDRIVKFISNLEDEETVLPLTSQFVR